MAFGYLRTIKLQMLIRQCYGNKFQEKCQYTYREISSKHVSWKKLIFLTYKEIL